MDIGRIKINLPKIGPSKENSNKKLANLNEPINDVYQKHSDSDVAQTMTELNKLNNSGRKFNNKELSSFKNLYQKGLINLGVVKYFKNGSDFDMENMAPIYQMRNDRADGPEFYDKVFNAIKSIPNGENATRFIQNIYEPTKEFSIGFDKENLNAIEEKVNDQIPLGKFYKFDADTGKLLEETNSTMSLKLPLQVVTNTKDFRNNTTVEKIQNVDAKCELTMAKQIVTHNDQNGKMISQEIMIPSAIKGMFDVEKIYANGDKEQISKSTFDKKTGIKTIKKNMFSPDGSKTEFLYEDDPHGNRILDYKITDENGNLLMKRSQTFEVIDDNHFISSQNGYKYEITTSDKKLVVKDLHHEKEAEIVFDKKCKGKKQEVINLLKKVSGDELLELINNVKVINGKDKEETLNSNFVTFLKRVNVSDNLMVFLHELGHAKDAQFDNTSLLNAQARDIFTNNKEVQKTFFAERDKFNATHSDTERENLKYFTQVKGHYAGEIGGLSEVVAETNAITNTYTDSQAEALGPRAHYLQQNFPKTIAKIKDLMNFKDDINAIEYYGT